MLKEYLYVNVPYYSISAWKTERVLSPSQGQVQCRDGFQERLWLWIWFPSFTLKAKKLMVSDGYHPFFKNSLFLKIGWSLFSTPGNWWSLLYYFLKFFLAQRAHDASLCKVTGARVWDVSKQTGDQTVPSSEMDKQFCAWWTQLKKTTWGFCIDCLGFSRVAWPQLDLQNIWFCETKAHIRWIDCCYILIRVPTKRHILSFIVSRNPKFIDLFLCRNS